MKKLLLIISSLFYRYYDHGSTKDIPYISTIGALFILIILNVGTICFYFNLQSFLFDNMKNAHKLIKYAKAASVFFSFYFFARWILPEKEVKAVEIEPKKRKLYGYLLIGYISLSLLLFILILSGNHRF